MNRHQAEPEQGHELDQCAAERDSNPGGVKRRRIQLMCVLEFEPDGKGGAGSTEQSRQQTGPSP
jgi:hypothetical protein